MNKKILVLLTLQLFVSALFGQDISGKWYEIEVSDANLEINIDQDKEGYSGTFSTERKNWINIANAPIDNIIVKKDSLLFDLTRTGFTYNYKLRLDDESKTYKGFSFYRSRPIVAVTFSRTPIERDLSIQAVSEQTPTRQDSLRGSITPERAWWDLTYYDLYMSVDIKSRSINGSNTIYYKVLKSNDRMQIDLQDPMNITKITQKGKALSFTKEGNAYFIQLNQKQKVGDLNQIKVFYEGVPREAPRAPWDGGFSWEEDANGKPHVYTSCQGEGASLWWPNKDHMYDEVDSMAFSINVPEDLMAVANGRLRSSENKSDSTITFNWFVSNPINNYGVSLNIADYAHFSEKYAGMNGELDCDYYVLKENLEKAKVQFKQVPMMLEAFEHWFGPFPFYEDGYKLVEGVGMEHQSAIGYSRYPKLIDAQDASPSTWGRTFDYLIIHESGHEWFANNITYKDMADMWVHEGFTCYSESLFLEYHYGKKAANEYLMEMRKSRVRNDKAIIGDYDINDDDYSGDIYNKSAVILHTLRQVINDDEKWRSILKGLNEEFALQTVITKDIEDYIANSVGMNLTSFWDQYLRTIQIPTLEYYMDEDKLAYRWINTVPGFDMPVKIIIDQEEKWIRPKTNWTQDFIEIKDPQLKIDPNFYVAELNSEK